jgi:riboflavin synthase
MFNGIIKNTGIIRKIIKQKKSLTILVYSNIKVGKKMIGSSISCDGVCLTLTNTKNRSLKFYLSKETLNRSNFSKIKVGTVINMEKSLKFGDEISGHYTQGHVDTVGKVIKIIILDKTWIVRIAVPSKFNKLIVEKASIHINGVSLTVSKKFKNYFEINIIPHTLKLTNLIQLKKNSLVNIEFDIFSKYILNINK